MKKTKSSKRKKRTRRNAKKYPALDKNVNLASRRELNDYDYLDKLNPEQLEFLNKFQEEFVNATVAKDGSALHNTDELRKDVYDRNNARNRDIHIKAQITGSLLSLDDKIGHVQMNDTIIDEDDIIDAIDERTEQDAFWSSIVDDED